MEQVSLYEGKIRKTFFDDEEKRNLWVRLNAERIRHAHNHYNHPTTDDLGDLDKPNSPYWISNNQLTYDEYIEDQPRLSLEELSVMNHDDLRILSEKRESDVMQKIWDEIVDNDDDDWVVYGGDEDFI